MFSIIPEIILGPHQKHSADRLQEIYVWEAPPLLSMDVRQASIAQGSHRGKLGSSTGNTHHLSVIARSLNGRNQSSLLSAAKSTKPVENFVCIKSELSLKGRSLEPPFELEYKRTFLTDMYNRLVGKACDAG